MEGKLPTAETKQATRRKSARERNRMVKPSTGREPGEALGRVLASVSSERCQSNPRPRLGVPNTNCNKKAENRPARHEKKMKSPAQGSAAIAAVITAQTVLSHFAWCVLRVPRH